MLGMIIYGILLRSKQNIRASTEKKVGNLRQILRAVNDSKNDLTNEWPWNRRMWEFRKAKDSKQKRIFQAKVVGRESHQF